MNFDDLFKNYDCNEESYNYSVNSSDSLNMIGGEKKDDNKNIPNGGFPPIYECDLKEEQEKSDIQQREYKTHKETISIKQILENRRKGPIFIK